MADRRDDFLQTTVQALAQRAGYLCSNPGCGAPTSGPSEALPHKGVNLGVAAHITGAAPDGPRYDPKLTSEQRRGAENGVWLCQNCSRLVDANGGADHPVAVLRAWKEVREASAGAVLGKPPSPARSVVDGRIAAYGVEDVVAADIEVPVEFQPGTEIVATGGRRVTALKLR